jgi:hypothetical protein
MKMAELDEAVARELASIVRKELDVLRDHIVELDRRLVTVEATNTLRATLEALSARLDRLEQKSAVRLAKGAA